MASPLERQAMVERMAKYLMEQAQSWMLANLRGHGLGPEGATDIARGAFEANLTALDLAAGRIATLVRS